MLYLDFTPCISSSRTTKIILFLSMKCKKMFLSMKCKKIHFEQSLLDLIQLESVENTWWLLLIFKVKELVKCNLLRCKMKHWCSCYHQIQWQTSSMVWRSRLKDKSIKDLNYSKIDTKQHGSQCCTIIKYKKQTNKQKTIKQTKYIQRWKLVYLVLACYEGTRVCRGR